MSPPTVFLMLPTVCPLVAANVDFQARARGMHHPPPVNILIVITPLCCSFCLNHTDMDSNKHRRETEPLPEDFILIGKDIQNKSGQSIGSLLTEERAFREFYGTTAAVVAKLWSFLLQRDMIPEEGMANHIMWALFFMKAYPKEGVTCLTVGGVGGAIDRKILRKYIWPFIHKIAELLSAVVSFWCMLFHNIPQVDSPHLF